MPAIKTRGHFVYPLQNIRSTNQYGKINLTNNIINHDQQKPQDAKRRAEANT